MSSEPDHKSSRQQKSPNETRSTPMWRLVGAILHQPRIVRVLIAGALALIVAFVITLVLFYNSVFYKHELEAIFAVLVLIFGLAMYLAGWMLIVGTVGETPPIRPEIAWYLGIGLVSVVLIVLWAISTAVSGAT